jgi:hypothetical protein
MCAAQRVDFPILDMSSVAYEVKKPVENAKYHILLSTISALQHKGKSQINSSHREFQKHMVTIAKSQSSVDVWSCFLWR